MNHESDIQQWLRMKGMDAYIFPSTDPHMGEYVPQHWETRKWASGFDGSAGTAVVTRYESALWTDSRYFLSAEDQLRGTGFQLMKEAINGTPTIAEWLAKQLPEGATVGMDGWVNTIEDVVQLRKTLSEVGLNLELSLDAAEDLWTDRPPIPLNEVEIHPLSFAGEAYSSKLKRLRQALEDEEVDGTVISTLDEIAWLTNLRGTDVHCNPVFVAYMLVTSKRSILFLDKRKVTRQVEEYLHKEGIELAPYENILHFLENYEGENILLDTDNTNWNILAHLPENCRVVKHASLVAPMKAIKNKEEIAGFHRAMRRDGVALVRMLRWLKPAVEKGGVTEMDVDRVLTELRSQQELYRDISFDTIAAYGSHGAIVHYEASSQTNATLEPYGFLLLDAGAQYQDGTTDITRTIPLGPLTESECLDYTLVLKGHIRLAMTKFPRGACGTQIDALARYAMWQHGINFLHGTGHGVGSYLNVHEGPHQIRMNYRPAPLLPGMTVTDEPGIYRTGKHGVRIENTMLITEYMDTDFGSFLQFKPLTLCPIDTTPIIWAMMQKDEIEYLNAYHEHVYKELSPLLHEEERQWLENATQRIII